MVSSQLYSPYTVTRGSNDRALYASSQLFGNHIPYLQSRHGESEARRHFNALTLPKSHDKKYRAVLFWGRRGKGKTLSMVWIAQQLQLAYKYQLKQHLPVHSNIWIEFADKSDPYLVEHMTQDDPFFAKDSLLCVDELTTEAPGRRPMSRVNLDILWFLVLIRKLRSEIVFTTQFPQDVDRSSLRQVDFFIQVEVTKHHDRPWVAWWYVFDYFGAETGIFRNLPWPPPLWAADLSFPVTGINSAVGKYRTEDLVAPRWNAQVQQLIMEHNDDGDDSKRIDSGNATSEYTAQQDSDAPPATIYGWADRQEYPLSLNGHVLSEARGYDATRIKNLKTLGEWFSANGYKVEDGIVTRP